MNDGDRMAAACIIGIGGYSGSGKTTLIERALRELKREGLFVGVLKHTSHDMLDFDREGKDTDRFFRAGAEFVLGEDSSQGFGRYPLRGAGLNETLRRVPPGLDLLLIEGFRDSSIPGIWIEPGKRSRKKVPGRPSSQVVIYREEPGHLEDFLGFIHSSLMRCHFRRQVRAGLLIGGKSTRMGRAKSLLKAKGETLAERSYNILSAVASGVVLLGAGTVPSALRTAQRLPDAPGVEGPLAGMLSAFRWDPNSVWIISAVDMPLMEKKAWQWLLGQRKPGVWAVLPRLGSEAAAETTGGCYEPMIFGHIETLASAGIMKLQEIARHPKVVTPAVLASLAHAWENVNTVEEWKRALTAGKKAAGLRR